MLMLLEEGGVMKKIILSITAAVLVVGVSTWLIYNAYFAPREPSPLEVIYPEGFEWPPGVDLPNPD
jgi:hypothetical protein